MQNEETKEYYDFFNVATLTVLMKFNIQRPP